MHQYATLEDTVYFGFAANLTSGAAGDGATPLFDVRLGGAASTAAPVLSGTPTLLTHANYSDGCYEVAVAATAANGFAAGNTYLVFVTLTISSVTPAAMVGTFTTKSISASVWDEVLTGATHNVATSAGRRLRTLDMTLDSGTATAGSADSITLATSASTTAGLYVGCRVYIDGGTGAGQSRYIVGYTAARVAWVARSWTVAPDATSTYVVAADNQIPFIHLGLATAGGASTITFDSGASATNNIYNGQMIRITAGTGDNQMRVITAYNGTTKVATVAPAWTVVPDSTSYFATLQTGPANVASVNNIAVAGAGTAGSPWGP